MRGNPDSCGIWAPCLCYADRRFWLVYTDVKRYDGAFKDAHNYIVTCETIDGQWSDPVYVNSSGFDPSLFHDDDERKWFVNMRWNHRGGGTGGNPRHASFDGILLQEWDPQGGLIREAVDIFPGSPRAHRGAAPFQAERLVLPDHGRGRHRLRPRGDAWPARATSAAPTSRTRTCTLCPRPTRRTTRSSGSATASMSRGRTAPSGTPS